MTIAQQLLTELKVHPELADAIAKQLGRHTADKVKSRKTKKEPPPPADTKDGTDGSNAADSADSAPDSKPSEPDQSVPA